MNYEGITLEFVNFIQQMKITKIDELIKAMKKYFSSSDMPKEDKEKLDRLVENGLEPIDIDSMIQVFQQNLDNENISISLDEKLIALKQDWEMIQSQDDYKVKSLKTKIINSLKKALEEQISDFKNEEHIKEIIVKSLEYNKLSFDVTEKITDIKNMCSVNEVNIDCWADIDIHQAKWIKNHIAISEKYDFSNWLDWASKNAKEVSFSTHPIKLTHSSISAASNIYDSVTCKYNKYLTTSSLSDKPIDIGSSNNAYAPIGKLLELKFNDVALADILSKNNISAFEQFAKDEKQLKRWQDGFSESFKNSRPSSHFLAKQIYFPILDNYHLISPLVSSSMTHVLFNKIREINFDAESIEIRKAKRENLYHPKIAISYPNIAIRMVTASQHDNASPLNGKRSGQSHLFPSIPPQWQSKINPPVKGKSLFNSAKKYIYEYFDKKDIDFNPIKELKNLLLAIKKEELSLNLERKQLIQSHVDEIIDALFNYVEQVHNLTNESGWTEKSKLSISHQLWLDPCREDDEFQKQRKETDWQEDICYDFSSWLNDQLRHKQLTLGKPQADYWSKIFRPRLREFEAVTEAKNDE